MTETFVWPPDMRRRMEKGWRGTVIVNGRRKPAWIVKSIDHRSLDGGFSWVLNTAYGPHGWSTPITHRSNASGRGPGCGKTTARHGLISRRGYIRIIREDIGVIERDIMLSELKALAKKLLTGRNATLFERRVIGPLEDPHTPRPSIGDLAIEFGISEQRVYKIITKCWKKIEATKRAADAKDEIPNMMANFTAKRTTGGLSFQSEGLYWDATDLPKATAIRLL
jgi:hypothetical protein